MKSKLPLGLSLPLLSTLLSGCGSLTYFQETRAVDSTGAFQLTDRDVVEPLNLGWLLARYAPNSLSGAEACRNHVKDMPHFGPPSAPQRTAGDGTSDQQASNVSVEVARLDQALAYFNCRAERAEEAQRTLARNGLQERMLAASQQRCNAFKSNLQREFSRNNFGLGLLTTIAGTAGALTAGAAASNWAGAAAVFSGTRAEYNQDYMSNLAAHVIVDGIEQRRASLYDQIQKQGQSESYARYPVEAAIKDAFRYHGECTVVAGFQQASTAIKFVNDPGLNGALQTLSRVKAVNKIMSNPDLPADEVYKITQTFTTSAPLLAGTAIIAPPAVDSDFQTSNAALMRIDAAAQATETTRQAIISAAVSAGTSAADLGLDKIRIDLTPLKTAKLQPACLGVAESYYTGELVATAKATLSEGKPRSDLFAEAASLRSKAKTLAISLSGLANKFSAAQEATRKGWLGLQDKAIKAAGPDRQNFKEISPPALDPALTSALMSLCGVAS